jgi:uncharacterized RDD family membrane protein YckC
LVSEPIPAGPDERRSGLPYPIIPPTSVDQLPERGQPGARAAWGLRALARIVDFVLVSTLFGFLVAAAGVETITTKSGKVDYSGPLWTLLLFPIGFMAYETILISRYGQTLGKWLCQVKAVRYSDGTLAIMQEALVRAVVPGVFLLVASAAPMLGISALGYLQFVPVLIYLASLADPLYRGPHDKAANTIVLAAPRLRAPRRPPA